MNSYLLDTSILVDYLRGQKKSIDLLKKLDNRNISIVTAGEIYQGCRNIQEIKKVKQFLNYFKVIAINEKASTLAIELIYQYTLSHHLLILDSLIAATALTQKYTLLTGNYKHFSMIKGFMSSIENPNDCTM